MSTEYSEDWLIQKGATELMETETVVPDKNMIDKYTSFIADIFNQ